MKKELIAHKDPKSPVSEVFRTLRTNIQFMNSSKKMKTLLITSTLPGEGKSWVASNLAVTFAQAGKKVILIDADMRKGRQYTIFGVSPKPGLSNYLSGIDVTDEDNADFVDYIQETEVKNLYLMVAGNIPPNPSELLISPQMINLLEQLKEVCDIVIIDGTPSALVTDSVILSRLCDSTVIVTAHKETKKDNLQSVIKNIQNVGGKIAGVVVNKIPISAKKYEQTYYYGSTSGNIRTSSKMSHSNSMKTNMVKNEELKRRASIVIDKNKDSENKDRDFNSQENSQTLKRNINIEYDNPISIEKTQDILKQINQYLDNEKQTLK